MQARPMQTRVELQDGTCTHIVQVATPAQVQFPEGLKEGTIVDVETFPSASPQGWSDIAKQIDEMHQQLKRLFFEHILTEQAIQELEPEY